MNIHLSRFYVSTPAWEQVCDATISTTASQHFVPVASQYPLKHEKLSNWNSSTQPSCVTGWKWTVCLYVPTTHTTSHSMLTYVRNWWHWNLERGRYKKLFLFKKLPGDKTNLFGNITFFKMKFLSLLFTSHFIMDPKKLLCSLHVRQTLLHIL